MSELKALSADWEAFCDSIKASGVSVLESAETTDSFERGEGLRYLTRLLKVSINRFVEYADVETPELFAVCDNRSGFGGDNPDNLYSSCLISDASSYRVVAERGTIWQFAFTVFRTGPGSEKQLLARLDQDDVDVAENGQFVIHVGGEPRERNWLPLEVGANQLHLRQTFRDRKAEQPLAARVEKLDGSAAPPKTGDRQMAARLGSAAQFYAKTARLMAGWSRDFSSTAVNVLPPVSKEFVASVGGDPSAHFYIAAWKLEPGKLLRVHIPAYVNLRLWNFALYNYWLESMDYENYSVHTNSEICELNPDGSATLTIGGANTDGSRNSLDTTGHQRGHMMLRVWSEGQPLQPRVELVDDTGLTNDRKNNNG